MWLGVPETVVADDDGERGTATYLAEGTRFGFVEGDWPIAGGRHPWEAQGRWEGHGTLIVHRPGWGSPAVGHTVWHFWEGPDRRFAGWYVNLQDTPRPTAIGYDTQDLELDIWVTPDGSWRFKDWDLLDTRVSEGRFTVDQVDAIRREGERLGAELEAGRPWWDPSWAEWTPDPSWHVPVLPGGWATVPLA